MINICVDARNITSQPTGIGRYARELMQRLPAMYPEVRWSAIRHPSDVDPFEGFEHAVVELDIGNAKDYALGSRALNRAFEQLGTPDLFHSFFHVVPPKIGAPFVTTLHDTIWIDHAKVSQPTAFAAFTIKQFAQRAIPDTLRRAERVIAVSQATADRALSWIDDDKVDVVSHGVADGFFEPVEPEEIVMHLTENDMRYVVAIGNDKPYKNFRRLIDAFGKLDPKQNGLRLALIGPCSGLQSYIDTLPFKSHVWLLGKLADSDLRAVLQHGDVFVFPSLVEGFGLPILEAMAAGVPTVVSDLAPMNEVAGGAAMLVDPRHVGAMSNAIRDALNPKVGTELKALGLARAKSLTWEETTRKTIDVYRRILD